MKSSLAMTLVLIVSLFPTACINYRVGNDVDNPTVAAAKIGKDCEPMLFGLGLEPTVNQALQNGRITKVRAMYDTNTSFFGIGRYCHVVVGE